VSGEKTSKGNGVRGKGKKNPDSTPIRGQVGELEAGSKLGKKPRCGKGPTKKKNNPHELGKQRAPSQIGGGGDMG